MHFIYIFFLFIRTSSGLQYPGSSPLEREIQNYRKFACGCTHVCTYSDKHKLVINEGTGTVVVWSHDLPKHKIKLKPWTGQSFTNPPTPLPRTHTHILLWSWRDHGCGDCDIGDFSAPLLINTQDLCQPSSDHNTVGAKSVSGTETRRETLPPLVPVLLKLVQTRFCSNSGHDCVQVSLKRDLPPPPQQKSPTITKNKKQTNKPSRLS